MRLQNELIAAKEREVTLMQRVRIIESNPKPSLPNADKTNSKQLKEQDCQTIENTNSFSNTFGTIENIIDQLSTKDNEIENLRSDFDTLNTEKRELFVKYESLMQTEEQFVDLTNMLATSEEDQNIQIASLYKDQVELKKTMVEITLKQQFVEEDLTQLTIRHSAFKQYHNRLIYELRKSFAHRKNIPLVDLTNVSSATDQITEELKRELVYIKAKMVRTIESSLNKFVDFDAIANIDLKNLKNKSIIEEDLSLSYITSSEWIHLTKKCEQLEMQNTLLNRNEKQAQELLRLAESQVSSFELINNSN